MYPVANSAHTTSRTSPFKKLRTDAITSYKRQALTKHFFFLADKKGVGLTCKCEHNPWASSGELGKLPSLFPRGGLSARSLIFLIAVAAPLSAERPVYSLSRRTRLELGADTYRGLVSVTVTSIGQPDNYVTSRTYARGISICAYVCSTAGRVGGELRRALNTCCVFPAIVSGKESPLST